METERLQRLMGGAGLLSRLVKPKQTGATSAHCVFLPHFLPGLGLAVGLRTEMLFSCLNFGSEQESLRIIVHY